MWNLRPVAIGLLAVALTGGCFWARPLGPIAPPRPVDGEGLAQAIAYLADDAREGRGLGTAGLEAAARYLAQGFRAAGLEPGGDGGDYLQRFQVPVSIEIAEAELALNGKALARGADFEAFLASGDGSGEAEVVFVGFGISDEESGFDEYAGLDVRGRVVLVLDHRPKSWDGSKLPQRSRFLSRAYKIGNARDHGAAAVLIAPSADEVEGLPGGAGQEAANPTTASVGIPALAVSRAAAERIVAGAGELSLGERQKTIEDAVRPGSTALGGVRVGFAVRVERRTGEVANVVGVIRGADPELRDEAVVIGAHYDHLGRGEFATLAPDRRGEIHNGADDNASGAAGILALARAFASAPPPRRSLVLVAFTGEEAGLLGSNHYVANPVLPTQATVAMLNLDMVGRLRERELTVFGVETSPDFEKLVRSAAGSLDLELRFTEGGFGPSDQTPFYAQGVPVLFFFTGTHSEYHTPDDDVDRLNVPGEADVLRLVYRVGATLLDASRRPRVVRAEQVPSKPGAGPGYGPYLGTVPDFGGPPVRGVRLAAVRPGSPAETAGLRAGDVIVEFDGASVVTLEEYAALLFAARAGQPVEIVVLRDGQRVAVRAVLGQRR